MSRVLLSHGMICDRVDKLAADIREDFPSSTIMFLVVLKGGNEFATDITRALRTQHGTGSSARIPFTVDFIRVKSYEGTESTGKGMLVWDLMLVLFLLTQIILYL